MKITLNNIQAFTNGKLPVAGNGKLDNFKIKKEIESSFQNTILPKEFKNVSDIGDIIAGHFVVLEKVLTHEGIKGNDKLKILMPFILRPSTETDLDNSNKVKEDSHIKDVLSLDIGIINSEFEKFYKIRELYLFEKFNGVIYAAKVKEEDKEEDKEKEEPKGDTPRSFHSKKFFWHNFLMELADGNIFKKQEAAELRMSEAMVYLAQKRSLEIIEYNESKQNSLS